MAGGTQGATLVTNSSFASSPSSLPDDCSNNVYVDDGEHMPPGGYTYSSYDDDHDSRRSGLSGAAIAAIVVVTLIGVTCLLYSCRSVKLGFGDQRQRHIIAFAESTERGSRRDGGEGARDGSNGGRRQRTARTAPVAAALSRVATEGDLDAVNSARRSGPLGRVAAVDSRYLDDAPPLAVATAATPHQCVELTAITAAAVVGPVPPHLLEEGGGGGGSMRGGGEGRDGSGGGGTGSSGRVALRGSSMDRGNSTAPIAAVIMTAKPVNAAREANL